MSDLIFCIYILYYCFVGVRQRHCLSIFVTLLMTTWGHLVPLVCTRGFIEILYLQTQQKYEAVLFLLYQIVPLFLNSQECLINCEKFQEILQNLLNADRGYISMAKSLVFTQNTVLQQFGNMIETQIVNFSFYGLENPRSLVRLWVNSLISIPAWNKDMGIMYLLNVIIRTGFLFTESLEVVYDILRDQQQVCTFFAFRIFILVYPKNGIFWKKIVSFLIFNILI